MNIDFIDIEKITVDKDHLLNVRKNIKFNKSVLKHYKRLLFQSKYMNNASFRKEMQKRQDFNPDSVSWKKEYCEKIQTMENKLSNLNNCNSLWLLNVYDFQKVKDFISTNLCKDRFCSNCKKVKQALRMARFIPEIEKFKHFNLYHLTLTIPSKDIEAVEGDHITGDKLRYWKDILFKSFTRLVNYFKGTKKFYIAGVDFKKFNYHGAIRSFEVTYKKGIFHPHLHVLFCLDFEQSDKNIVNDYSKRFGKVERYFSKEEIFLQKLWRLIVIQERVIKDFSIKRDSLDNNKKLTLQDKTKKLSVLDREFEREMFKTRVNKKALDDLKIGYSVAMDLFKEDHYFEMFKYMTKAQDDKGNNSSYQDFLHLYFQLKSVRQIQGYGCFFRIQDLDIKEEVDLQHDTLLSILDSVELPRVSAESPDDLFNDDEYRLISRKKHHGYLRAIIEKENQKEKEGCEPSLKNG